MVDMQFYEYVSKLLYEAGHMITSDPVYTNHSASEALYIDSSKDVAVSRFDRTLLMQISNISQLLEIKWPGVVDDLTENVQIYSITIDAPDRNRSHIVADVHRLLHQYWDCHHSIIFFKNRQQYIISFANKDHSHILSDWFDINVDLDDVVEKIDIANISLENSIGYFSDFIYSIARKYYLYPISVEEATYGMIPLTFVASAFGVKTEASKDDIKALAKANLLYYETLYGDDYVAPILVGYDEQAQFRRMATELDRISFELELAAELDDDGIGAAFDDDSDELDEFDDGFDDELDDDLDPAIFDDPVLMVKWLERHQSQYGDKSFTGPKSPRPTPQRPKPMSEHNSDEDAVNRHINEVVFESAGHQRPVESEEQAIPQTYNNHADADAHRGSSVADELIKEAQVKRAKAHGRRQEACRLREEATRLMQDSSSALSLLTKKRTAYDGLCKKRDDAAEALYRQKQQMAYNKRNEAEHLRSLAVEKRKEAIRIRKCAMVTHSRAEKQLQESVAMSNRLAEMQLEMAERRRQYLAAEHRERERLEAERREQERLAEERRQQEELRQIHQQNLLGIQQKKNEDISAINSALAAVNMRLKEIEQRLSTLTFLQFAEKRNLKAEQAELIERKTNLSKRHSELESKYKALFAEEKQRYEDCVSHFHMQ